MTTMKRVRYDYQTAWANHFPFSHRLFIISHKHTMYHFMIPHYVSLYITHPILEVLVECQCSVIVFNANCCISYELKKYIAVRWEGFVYKEIIFKAWSTGEQIIRWQTCNCSHRLRESKTERLLEPSGRTAAVNMILFQVGWTKGPYSILDIFRYYLDEINT
jgi:hypothetical protein